MKPALQQLLFHSVSSANILPITSICNVKCVFCSNPLNPPGTEVFQLPPLALGDIEMLLDFIEPEKKIIIGESVTRINEGEPLTHPHFKEVLESIRKRFPHTPIQITTNGNNLTEQLIDFVANLGGIGFNVSLNSCSLPVRRRVMGTSGQRALTGIKLFEKYKIAFNGSIVALPQLTGWQDLEETILFLEEYGGEFTRVFLPGYTRLVQDAAKFEESIGDEVHNFISELRNKVNMPVSCEPARITGLEALVEGVFPGSPSAVAGLRIGDQISEVGGEQVFSRVDAFNKLKNYGGVVPLTIIRAGQKVDSFLSKKAGESPGVLMAHDIDPACMLELVNIAAKKGCQRMLLMASGLGEQIIRNALEKLNPDMEFFVQKTANTFFGGTIKSAGLLVVQDFIRAWNQIESAVDCDIMFIPQIAFDPWGRDLSGTHYLDLNEAIPIPVELI